MRVSFLAVSILCAFVLLTGTALAQTQPADTYTYSGMSAGLTVNAFGEWKINDFFFSYLNESGGSISIQTQLTTTSGNAWADCNQTGSTFTYANTDLGNDATYAWNVVNLSVLADVNNYFDGSLTATELNNNDFYIGPPSTFTANTPYFESTICSAYFNAWESGSWTPPWFWDGGSVSLLVSPYANYWNNNIFWTTGWNTQIQVTNNGSSTIGYTIDYISDSGGSPQERDTTTSCTASTLNDSVLTGNVSSGGGMWSGYLEGMSGNYIFDPTSGYGVEEDGALTMSLSTVISGSYPYSYIAANGSGSASSCTAGGSCSNTGSTQGQSMVTSCYH